MNQPSYSEKFIGRVGGLAVALGIGVGLAAMPGTAYAEPADSGSLSSSSSSASEHQPNISVSTNGAEEPRVKKGTRASLVAWDRHNGAAGFT
jgi:hypothetical protein